MNFSTKIKRNRPFLGTFIEIGAYSNRSEVEVLKVVDLVYVEIARLEGIFSVHDLRSELFKLNTNKVLDEASIELRVLLRLVKFIASKTEGLFDPSLPFRDLHDGNWMDIKLEGRKIRFERGLRVDMGGIAKGFIVDKAVKLLGILGIEAGIVNAGGDLRCFGEREFCIKIRDPFSPMSFVDLGMLSNVAVASSSLTREIKEIGGKSVLVGNANFVHATVVSGYCFLSDALTKVCMIEPAFAKLFGAKVYLVDQNNRFLRYE